MKTANIPNLDDPQEAQDFLAGYGHLLGIRLARSLGLYGAGSVVGAHGLLQYAQVKVRATEARLAGKIALALEYERLCDAIYMRLPEQVRW